MVPEGIIESDFRNLTNEATAVYHLRYNVPTLIN